MLPCSTSFWKGLVQSYPHLYPVPSLCFVSNPLAPLPSELGAWEV